MKDIKSINYTVLSEIHKSYQGKNWRSITEEYNLKMNDSKLSSNLRRGYSKNKDKFQQFIQSEEVHESTRYQELSTDKYVTEEELLEMHGYDPELWQIQSSNSTRSKIGTKQEEKYFINTYSKITVKPKVFELTKDLLNTVLVNSNIKPITVDKVINKPIGLLEIPLFDMHFGNNSYEYYKDYQAKIFNYIRMQEWEQTLFIIGQDLFHNDNFRGSTSNGTPIAHEDMAQAWEDALSFYAPLIEESIRQSDNVNIIYSRGNHDETLAWSFVKMLEVKYPQVKVCSKQQEHQHFIYKNIFLGYTHGDRINDKKIVRNFEALFRLEMAQAKRRILKKGHIHTLKQFDDNGTQVLTLGTANESDDWHIENGFIGNHKSFELFVYNEDSLKAHLYID